ncbi:multiple cyclophane-containing RiPP AmcA [Catellatospora citrea]|uniref:Uncharacterized protein n=1 Tax=Catellatospora citrea TaxID=53366 RepID=A0A8J3NZB4_9ACTN|nr:multiple cyclophane-containing RiPP AmcA [Catellatospora citrea]RKE00408.1 hypothetical protein C8E86_8280 [Catellatospora citrea]GIF98068.1 hypothetical protein Cci01nite_31620 [Catellatospora citrea]
MTTLQLLATADRDDLAKLGITAETALAGLPNGAKFDNRPTWDNGSKGFDNRPTWDNWSKSKK